VAGFVEKCEAFVNNKSKGGLGTNSFHIRFNKGHSHRDIAKKASIPQKMSLKHLEILEKASISLKKSSKSLLIFKKSPLLGKCI
jgi:hypothetical protein